jgi:hypothetical protein
MMFVPVAIRRWCFCFPVAIAAAAWLPAMPALAQSHAVKPPKLEPAAPERQPAALPGATSSATAPDHAGPRPDLAPNLALFDAVNRGDKAAARDAVNRGADIEARNVLGLTPLELSVDLGRNDITFLLLSLRSGAGAETAPRPLAAKPKAAPPVRVAAAQPIPSVPHIEPSAPRPTPAQQARPVLGTDPGVPAPQVGFLGFGNAP